MRFGIGTVEDLTWKQMMDAMSCTECGRCQDACPAFATGKTLSPKLVIMGVRDHLFEEGPKALAARASGRGVRRAAGRRPARQLEEMAWDCVTCGACVEACPVNIEHDRPHPRPAPPPGDGRVALPERGRADAARRRAPVEPVGQAAVRARGVDGGPRTSACSSRATPAPEVLYWVGCAASFDERARETAQSTAKLLTGGRRRLRDPRPARGLHRRPGAPDGQRVRLPGLRRAERRDARRGGRDEDRRELPALLQHARARIPRLRRALRGRPPHRDARRAGARGPAVARPRASRRSPTTTPATWPATTTCARSRASWPPPSASRSRWSGARRTRSAAARAARTCGWRSARGPINEERVRQAAETGAETLAVACPFCTVMLDDGVQQQRERHARRRRRDAARRGDRPLAHAEAQVDADSLLHSGDGAERLLQRAAGERAERGRIEEVVRLLAGLELLDLVGQPQAEDQLERLLEQPGVLGFERAGVGRGAQPRRGRARA